MRSTASSRAASYTAMLAGLPSPPRQHPRSPSARASPHSPSRTRRSPAAASIAALITPSPPARQQGPLEQAPTLRPAPLPSGGSAASVLAAALQAPAPPTVPPAAPPKVVKAGPLVVLAPVALPAAAAPGTPPRAQSMTQSPRDASISPISKHRAAGPTTPASAPRPFAAKPSPYTAKPPPFSGLGVGSAFAKPSTRPPPPAAPPTASVGEADVPARAGLAWANQPEAQPTAAAQSPCRANASTCSPSRENASTSSMAELPSPATGPAGEGFVCRPGVADPVARALEMERSRDLDCPRELGSSADQDALMMMALASHGGPLSPAMSLQTALGFESASSIGRSGSTLSALNDGFLAESSGGVSRVLSNGSDLSDFASPRPQPPLSFVPLSGFSAVVPACDVPRPMSADPAETKSLASLIKPTPSPAPSPHGSPTATFHKTAEAAV